MEWMRRWVERRLGGYRHPVNSPGAGPERDGTPRTVVVVGGGLAGVTAAVTLGRRGWKVILKEKHPYLGGKVGAWPVALPAGEIAWVEHGYHAFFPHYHNLNRFLDSLDLRRSFRSIGDYAILALDGRRFSFRDVDKTPGWNLLSLAGTGVWNLGQVLANPRLVGLLAMLRYDPVKTFVRFDDVSYEAWARSLGLPASMRLMFNSFSRAFFASPDRMSTAELLKSFHSFFLSQDGGLIYDSPADDYETAFWRPLRAELDRLGAQIRLGEPVSRVEPRDGGYLVDGEPCDAVVLAADAGAVRRLVENSPGLGSLPFRNQVGSLKASQGYAVLRLWTDRRLDTDLPGFVITEHRKVLDSVSFYHDLEEPSRAWADRTGGGVYELHCYALPDGLTDPGEIRDALVEELGGYFPSLRGMSVIHGHLQVNHDFTALHTGMSRHRPGTDSGLPGLVLAGDWVKLPFPAMLMEAAASSGIAAANTLLRQAGLREEPLVSVPPRGLLARRKSFLQGSCPPPAP